MGHGLLPYPGHTQPSLTTSSSSRLSRFHYQADYLIMILSSLSCGSILSYHRTLSSIYSFDRGPIASSTSSTASIAHPYEH